MAAEALRQPAGDQPVLHLVRAREDVERPLPPERGVRQRRRCYIQNQATANLYYYTPYQPNAAALRAGYGEGDGCSAYGNRNFYQYFTDWFGSTQRDPAAEIDAEYHGAGWRRRSRRRAVSGVLTLTQNGGGYARAYAAGSIYWSTSTGAKTVLAGPLRDYYFGRSGADGDMGWPAVNQQSLTTASGSGVAQLFTGGSLYSSAKGTFIVRDPLRGAYFAYDGALGRLGWPTSDQTCGAGVCTQQFEGGSRGVVAEWGVRVVRSGACGVRCCGWGVGCRGVCRCRR